MRRIAVAALLGCATALGQSAAPTPAKPLAFEVVSIRPSKPPSYPGATGGPSTTWGTQPDGYRASNQTIWSTIAIAYFPQGMPYWTRDRILNAPKWATESQYDINAKVSELDLPEWTKQGLALDKKPMFRQMLQTMLADRCHLVSHMVPGVPISGWSLEGGKHATRLTESKPGATLPAGVKLRDGGVMVPYQRGDKPHLTFYAATMADLAQNLSMSSMGHPVQDHTGLTGHYDFIVNWVSDPDSKIPEGVIDSNDPDPLSHWNIDALGLHLTPIKLPVDTLVIDHIEKPSEN